MKTFLQSGHQTVELRRRQDSSPADTVLHFRNPDLALIFLRKLKSDFSSMDRLRRFVVHGFGYTSLSRMNDHQVMQLLARKIADQQVKVVLHGADTSFKGSAPQPNLPESPPSPAGARPAARQPVKPMTPPPPPMDEAVFAPGVDAAAQSAALKSAAQAGIPFCEECEKARLARQKIA